MTQAPTAPIERTVRIPLERAAAFTLLAGRIGAWWPGARRQEGCPDTAAAWRLDGRTGGHLWREDDAGEVPVAEVAAWEDGRRIVLDLHGDAPCGRVQILFMDADDGTSVTVNHAGWAPVLDPGVPLTDATGVGFDHPWERRPGTREACAQTRLAA